MLVSWSLSRWSRCSVACWENTWVVLWSIRHCPSTSFGRRLRRKVLQYALETLHWHHRSWAVFCTEGHVARAKNSTASLCSSLDQRPYCKTFGRPGAAGAAPTPHHEDRSAGWQEGARAQATYWSECRLHGYSVHDAVGHRTRRLHHAAHSPGAAAAT